jgi:hypothetical protein
MSPPNRIHKQESVTLPTDGQWDTNTSRLENNNLGHVREYNMQHAIIGSTDVALEVVMVQSAGVSGKLEGGVC